MSRTYLISFPEHTTICLNKKTAWQALYCKLPFCLQNYLLMAQNFVVTYLQDTQLLLWDLALDEIVVPLRHPSSASPTFSSGSPSAHWDNACPPTGVLQPSPRMRDVPKLSPLVAHRAHADPLSGLVFTNESILTICREGLIKIWVRPDQSENNQQSNSSEFVLGNPVSKDRAITSSNKASNSSFKRPSPVLVT